MTATDDMLLDTLALVPVSNHQTLVVPPHSQQNQQLQIVPISITQQPPHGMHNQQNQFVSLTAHRQQNQQQQLVPTTTHQNPDLIHPTTQNQNQPTFNSSSQPSNTQQAMLQFTQYNIQQTQVQVQVTTQVETYLITSTQRQPQANFDVNNESLPLNYQQVPPSAPLMPVPPGMQCSLRDLSPELWATLPPQRQRRLPLHPPGQTWNPVFDKGKAVITHTHSTSVAPPQTLDAGIY
jgi:hypothetical protein